MNTSVLSIDDLPENHQYIRELLRKRLPEMVVLTAMSAKEGVRLANERRPDLILLDVRMPDTDGYEVCRQLKNDPGTAPIPILMISGVLTSSDDRTHGLECGAEGYLCKPFNRSEFYALVESLLRIKRDEDLLRETQEDLRRALAEREAGLRESKDRFRLLVNNLEEVFWITNADGSEILYLSPAIERLWQRKAEEFYRNPELWLEPIHPEDRSRVMAAFAEKARRGDFDEEYRIVRKDGAVRWIRDRGSPVHDAAGEVYRVVGTAEDITARKHMEQAAAESEERHRRLVENLRQDYFFYQHDTHGVFGYISPSIRNVLGYTEKEFMTHYTQYLTDAAMNREVVTHTEKSIRGVQQPPYEVEIFHKDGEVRRLEVLETPVRDAEGRVTGVEGIAHDVTKARAAEAKLRSSEQRYRAVVEDQTELICRFTPDGVLTFVNDAYGRFFDHDPQELVGKKWIDFLPEEDRAAVQQRLDTLSPDSPVQTHEHQVLLRDGEIGWQEWTNRALYDAEGALVEFQAIGRDISEQKRAQQRRERVSSGLNTVLDMTDELLGCADLDTLYRRAVELPREKLGFERCGLMLEEGDQVCGTYGTDRHGETVDEYDLRLEKNTVWLERFRARDINEPHWNINEEEYKEWDGKQVRTFGKGPIAITAIQSSRTATRPLGIFMNDNAVSGKPLDTALQEVLAVYGSVLAHIMERRKLEDSVIQAGERERGRIGRDLHDDLGQYLAGVAFQLKTMENKLSDEDSEEVGNAGVIRTHVEEAMLRVKNLSRGLNPFELKQHGLVSALTELAVGTKNTYDVHCEVHNRGYTTNNARVEAHLYRIVQEAISNAIRHGGASRIDVTIGEREGRLELSVRDNGAGVPEDFARKKGMGIHSMAYRAERIGGMLDVGRAAAGGTLVLCRAPIAKEARTQ